ncbi:hypothetical protein [Micromonospora sp. WMMD998]|uniref:hypothetical protein n=1 Tax=Micromonospora sp. WMMD998 TaxID=3016092 RepID=UPI00249BBE4E|nr:hypothetical protein [Micromonospora sp. WMMD998]WFE40171.1 hypothetical protein O7619_17680 [Micromonospora sp. WMMD998]
MNTSDSAGRDSGAEKLNWIDRRREKIRAEIERNRRGDHRVPTWVLAAVLVLIVVGWLSFVYLAG